MSLKIIAHANIPYMTINDPLLSDLQRMKNIPYMTINDYYCTCPLREISTFSKSPEIITKCYV